MPDPVHIFGSSVRGALHQGEVLSGVKQYVRVPAKDDTVVGFLEIVHPYCVVLSQECDLDWDFTARADTDQSSTKLLINVLCCAAVEEDDIRQSKGLKSDIWRRVKNNKDERFQYLEECPSDVDATGIGVPPLVLDFKGYFTIPTTEIYEQLQEHAFQRCRLTTPHAEHLSLRFAYFQARVALPRDHGTKSADVVLPPEH